VLREIGHVHMFCFVLNGCEMRWDMSTHMLLQIFEDNFGSGFWKNLSIVYTWWANDPRSVKKREKSGLKKEDRVK